MRSTRFRGAVVAASFALSLAAAPAAFAWGQVGHSIVASLAQRQLDPKALAEVKRLLATENDTDLADIASWPDQLRDNPDTKELGKATAKLHYVDFNDPTCVYSPPKCPDGQCVVEGIRKYVAILGDRSKSDAERREALSFVVHFIGDVHQPLHAGYRDDKGGNDFQVQFQGKGSNLHKVWDSGMLYTRNLQFQAYADLLAAQGAVTLPKPISPLDNPYAQWAEESCKISKAPGFYPDKHEIDDAYVAVERPVAEERLREAGKRLADVLNKTLD